MAEAYSKANAFVNCNCGASAHGIKARLVLPMLKAEIADKAKRRAVEHTIGRKRHVRKSAQHLANNCCSEVQGDIQLKTVKDAQVDRLQVCGVVGGLKTWGEISYMYGWIY